MTYEVMESGELAKRWRVPETWIRDQVRTRATDPLPHLRFGRYIRFEWEHPDLVEWYNRRRNKK